VHFIVGLRPWGGLWKASRLTSRSCGCTVRPKGAISGNMSHLLAEETTKT